MIVFKINLCARCYASNWRIFSKEMKKKEDIIVRIKHGVQTDLRDAHKIMNENKEK